MDLLARRTVEMNILAGEECMKAFERQTIVQNYPGEYMPLHAED